MLDWIGKRARVECVGTCYEILVVANRIDQCFTTENRQNIALFTIGNLNHLENSFNSIFPKTCFDCFLNNFFI